MDANRLEFLVLGTTDPFLEMAGLSRVETITYTLHEACGFSKSEIASLRKVTGGTVKRILSRAKGMVKAA